MEAKQWQELCEWAEFRKDFVHIYLKNGRFDSYDRHVWIHDFPNYCNVLLPPKDMNTLWRWMVPKLEELKSTYCIYACKNPDNMGAHCADVWFYDSEVVKQREKDGLIIKSALIDKDPVEALAQALYKVVRS